MNHFLINKKACISKIATSQPFTPRMQRKLSCFLCFDRLVTLLCYISKSKAQMIIRDSETLTIVRDSYKIWRHMNSQIIVWDSENSDDYQRFENSDDYQRFENSDDYQRFWREKSGRTDITVIILGVHKCQWNSPGYQLWHTIVAFVEPPCRFGLVFLSLTLLRGRGSDIPR